jgi:ribosome-associated heat shock protein Hsp15
LTLAHPDPPNRRLDQWLWFARFTKSRSLAARLCAAGMVTVNGATARKPSQSVRIGDAVAVPQGTFCRIVRVLDLGLRRGPPQEARRLYKELATPVRLPRGDPGWAPLLEGGPADCL